MSLSPGTRLGPYELLLPLGAGGMGEVWRARDTRLEREVALKVIGKDLLADDGARKRFRKEAQALAKLNHPHIAQIHDFASDQGVEFLVMELVPGATLSERIAGGAFSEAEVVKFGRELAEGLSAAHGEGVIHCDLKPDNLRLDRAGVLKILDFGIARLRRPSATGEATVTATEIGASGTLPYMAPEQLRAEPLDARTDVWGAGVVLYEMATGARPFREAGTANMTDAILHAAPEPPSTRRPAVRRELERVILKCLEKDPGRRYQSANELALDLERLASPSGPSEAVVSRAARPRWAPVAALALLMALAATVAVLRPWRGVSRVVSEVIPEVVTADASITSLAVLPLDNMTGDPGQEYFADGMTEALITELAKIRSLKVISRKSVMRFKKSDMPLPEIAKLLGVEGVVEGSVMRGSGRVKITAQLIRAATDAHIWADSFDRQEADVLALQSDVARAVASQVRAAVTPDEQERLASTRKVNPEAYDLALRAVHLAESAGGADEANRALALAERAVALDPDMAQAQLALATALNRLPDFGEKTGSELRPRLTAAVDRALALDPTLARAHTLRAACLPGVGDDVRRELKRAIELAPNDGFVRTNYAYYLSLTGHYAEADEELKRGLELDPLNLVSRCTRLSYLYAARRDQETLDEAQRILDLDPNWFWALDAMSRVAFWQGRYDDAIAWGRKEWRVAFGTGFGPPDGMTWEAYKRWLPDALKDRDRKPYSTAGIVAATYAMLGEKEKAFPFLETSVDRRDIWTGQLNWPDFDSLRGDPRFEAAVRRLDLPVEVFRKPARELAAAESR